MINGIGDYYIQAVIMSIISVGFYFYELNKLKGNMLKTFFKLVFSFCSAWILCTAINGSMPALVEHTRLHASWFIVAVKYIFPYISFIGFQMLLYGLFNED